MDMLVKYSLLRLCSSIYQPSVKKQVSTGGLCVQLEIAALPERQGEAHGRMF